MTSLPLGLFLVELGVCAMSNGAEYDACEIDRRIRDAASPEGWQCSEGRALCHRACPEDGTPRGGTVATFCSDTAHELAGWTKVTSS